MLATQKHRTAGKHKRLGQQNLLSTVPHQLYDESKHKPILSLKKSYTLNIFLCLSSFILFFLYIHKYSQYSDQIIALERDHINLMQLTEKIEMLQKLSNKNSKSNPIIDQKMHTSPNMMKEIAQKDLITLEMKYGTEKPIYILLDTDKGMIVIEMAPFESMPHVILYFLTLVESQFWNGCHFFRNADHVIQANCHGRKEKHKKTSHILYQEYNNNLSYLHKKYSIGLAGRPGGPDFYVNLRDNVRNHGPGGQGPEADPCFGRVVDGFNVIDKIHGLKTDGTRMKILVDWVKFNEVAIIDFELLTKQEGKQKIMAK